MKRRQRVTVAIDPTIPAGTGEPTWLLRARSQGQAPTTSAHDTDADTPCCVCGGPAHPRAPEDWGPWRRHPKCSTLTAYEPSRIEAACHALAIPLDSDADLVRFSVPTYASVHPEPTWSDDEPMRSRLPWRHVSRDRLAAAVAELPRLRVEWQRVDAPFELGPCAWCGVVEARGWDEYGHTWHDGSEAGLCGDCGRVYVRFGSPNPQFWEDQREAIASAITSTPGELGGHVPGGLLGFAEGSGDGDGTPWSHLPAEAVEAFRWARWTASNGAYAPAEHRAEALARVRADEAAWAKRNAARLAEEARKQDTYGFGVAR